MDTSFSNLRARPYRSRSCPTGQVSSAPTGFQYSLKLSACSIATFYVLVFFESPPSAGRLRCCCISSARRITVRHPSSLTFHEGPQKETFSLCACVETPVGHLSQDPHPRRRCTREGAVLAIGTYAGDTIVVLYHSWVCATFVCLEVEMFFWLSQHMVALSILGDHL